MGVKDRFGMPGTEAMLKRLLNWIARNSFERGELFKQIIWEVVS